MCFVIVLDGGIGIHQVEISGEIAKTEIPQTPRTWRQVRDMNAELKRSPVYRHFRRAVGDDAREAA